MDWSKQKRSSFSVGSGYKPANYVDYERYPQIPNPPQHSPAQAQLPVRSAYYETHWPLSRCAWSCLSASQGVQTVAVGTYKEDNMNKVEVIQGNPSLVEHANGTTSEGLSFTKVCDGNVVLPITKLAWDPTGKSHKLLTTNDKLRLWELDGYQDPMLVKRATLANKQFDSQSQRSGVASYAPLTSFDWNKVNSNIVITSSIDTTCTVWDLTRPNYPQTQLIAHDSEVFDVEFIKGSTDVFASVGCDGSMRVFDLRSLEHSTIIYEPPASGGVNPGNGNSAPLHSHGESISLLRVATSNTDANVLATFAAKSDKINVLDMRYPGMPVLMLKSHASSVNSIEWHPSQPYLLSGGDDCQALVWDVRRGVSDGKHHHMETLDHPDFAYTDTMEVNDASWAPMGDWFGVVSGKGVQGVRMG